MNILITYDSYYGNTKKIANTIYTEISKNNNTKLLKVKYAIDEPLSDFDLIIIGSPTRAFAPTSKIKKFVRKIPSNIAHNISIAVFDTRSDIKKINNKFLSFMEKRFGYANDTIENILRKKLAPKVHYEKFYVRDSEGPLEDRQIEKAIEFAKYLQIGDNDS